MNQEHDHIILYLCYKYCDLCRYYNILYIIIFERRNNLNRNIIKIPPPTKPIWQPEFLHMD